MPPEIRALQATWNAVMEVKDGINVIEYRDSSPVDLTVSNMISLTMSGCKCSENVSLDIHVVCQQR